MAEEKEKQEILAEMIRDALVSKELPKFYANGFVNFYGSSDVGILLKVNDQPLALLNLSYTVAKSLSQKLISMIEDFERKTGREIMTTDFIEQKMASGGTDDTIQ